MAETTWAQKADAAERAYQARVAAQTGRTGRGAQYARELDDMAQREAERKLVKMAVQRYGYGSYL